MNARTILYVLLAAIAIPAMFMDIRTVWNRGVLPVKLIYSATKPPEDVLLSPLANVSVASIANSWHAPRSGGRLHEGQDIFAPRGTPVYAATPGYVLSRGENRLGGLYVMIMGTGGRQYYYAHLDRIAPELSVGDHVTTKTIVGYVGTTGNARGTAPHLHFGVFELSGAIDPLPLLVDR